MSNELDIKQLICECNNFLSEKKVKLKLTNLRLYKLLHCFILAHPEILTYNELQDIFGFNMISIRTYICKLRKQISPIKIRSVSKVGYRLIYRR